MRVSGQRLAVPTFLGGLAGLKGCGCIFSRPAAFAAHSALRAADC